MVRRALPRRYPVAGFGRAIAGPVESAVMFVVLDADGSVSAVDEVEAGAVEVRSVEGRRGLRTPRAPRPGSRRRRDAALDDDGVTIVDTLFIGDRARSSDDVLSEPLTGPVESRGLEPRTRGSRAAEGL